MTTESERVAADRERIERARAEGAAATLRTYVRLSGPGWLQSAITLGGGSLASALYLGVLTGTGLMWLQLLAMLLGVVMLAAISHVTLTTGKRPFGAICEHVSPVLGWGWILAVLLANLVWSLPQFSLGTAAITQNLLGGATGTGAKVASSVAMLGVATAVIWAYDSGAKGVKIFEGVLKGMVGLVVVCFFGVVVTLSIKEGIDWGGVFGGFVPNPSLLSEPAPAFDSFLAQAGAARDWWAERIVGQQRDVMIAAAATAVGINMTFLLPYSMLKKGWGRSFRGLAVFDLSTGLLIPYVLATSCVVIAASSQFHGELDERLLEADGGAPARLVKPFEGALEARANALPDVPVTDGDRRLSALLVKRDAFDLAKALEPLAGTGVARYVFGIGVLGMALSTIIILMLISGFTFCEMFDRPATGGFHRMGCLAAGIGVLGPFVWADAAFWLAVPTSVFGMVLLPVAYWAFIFMMNSRSLMGDGRPEGASRARWNTLMIIAAGIVTPASLYSAYTKAGWWGLGGIAAFVAAAVVFRRRG